MKRLPLTALSIFFSVSIFAQNNYSIDDQENVLSQKERQTLEKMVDYELMFFNKLLPSQKMIPSDVKINIFQNYGAYLLYQEQIMGIIRYKSMGFYSSRTKEVIVCKEKNDKNFMKTCYHELSHYFMHARITSPPAWLNEGLATYFGFCSLSSKNVKPQRNEYLMGRLKTMIELKDIDLKDFITWDQKKFSQTSFTQDSYGYAIGYCMIYYLLQKDENMTINIIQNIMQDKSSKEAFDVCYPGGFNQFEKDFMEYYSKG